ncbi:hypothetical protein [Flexithrix dorotheae]|uniref:hypothetical protein n=1 Tax=Flexithrix dorotheae TaxID=70993 RepID=UPI000377250E|nr:hypothetical protein [Flexithrix dorotheae]
METCYHFSVLKGSWGISISLKAEFVPFHFSKSESTFVTKNIQVIFSPEIKLLQDEIQLLVKGIKEYEKQIIENVRYKEIGIRINEIDFAETDFQCEALYFAVIGWICKTLNLNEPEISVLFDNQKNKYLIEMVNK